MTTDARGIWAVLSERIANAMGLWFPPERWNDLQRGLREAAPEFGFTNLADCAETLGSAPLSQDQVAVLARHLTIGETYFHRDARSFAALATKILPELIHARRGHHQHLRLWSAACASGEEAYSLAILVHQLLPDLEDWKVTILATDINSRSLAKATAAVYGDWSFRDEPAGFRANYFRIRQDGRYEVLPHLREMVTFKSLNLVEDVFPSSASGVSAMDVIFCRNVLMYFSPEQSRKAVDNLYRTLNDGGWLGVSPCETSSTLFSRFAIHNFPGMTLYRRGGPGTGGPAPLLPTFALPSTKIDAPLALPHFPPLPTPPKAEPFLAFDPPPAAPRAPASFLRQPAPATTDATATPLATALALQLQGRRDEALTLLLDAAASNSAPEPALLATLTRALANQGRLADALACCDRWIAADKLDPAAHYFRAVVLLEQSDRDGASRSLQRAVYLRPDFVIAHFAMGNLARTDGRTGDATRHYNNASRLLADLPPESDIPEADGLTVARLRDLLTAFQNPTPDIARRLAR